MPERFIKAMSAGDIARGGMKAMELNGKEIVICNCGGKYHTIQRRCGHMNAPLEMGTLDGIYVTCPMHCAQFDITTGEALSGPVPSDSGQEIPPPFFGEYMKNIQMMMKQVCTKSIRIYETKLEDGWVQIRL
jgi:nitrite reductase/ring-hydroxylating ferredoxin subunit